MKAEIKQDLKGMKNEILDEVRKIVKIAVENMTKEMKDKSKEIKQEMKEIQGEMTLPCSDQSARVVGKQEAETPAVEDTRIPTFAAKETATQPGKQKHHQSL